MYESLNARMFEGLNITVPARDYFDEHWYTWHILWQQNSKSLHKFCLHKHLKNLYKHKLMMDLVI